MVKMNLVQVRTHEFFTQFMRLATNERHLQSREHGDQKLRRPVGINARVGIGRLYLAQCARDHQKAMRIASHETETVDKGIAVTRARMNQVREVFSFHDTDLFQPSNGVVYQQESPLFNSRKPSLETREIERILLTRIHQERRAWRLELCAPAFC